MRIMHRGIAIAFFLSTALLAGTAFDASAQKLSDRPITIIVPYSPGTGPDILARLIGEEIQQR
jgi:tripartite-type tricarboxylate transporter receptor subunit TctC